MKLIFTSILLLFSISIAEGQDIIVLSSPDNIKCNINRYLQNAEQNVFNDCYPLMIKNNSDKIIYRVFTKIDFHYDSSICYSGNYILIDDGNPICLFPGDTAIYNLIFEANYENTIKNNLINIPLKSDFIYYYREYGSNDLDSMIIPITFMAVDSNKVFTLAERIYHGYNYSGKFGMNGKKSKNYGYFYNTSGKAFIVDSIKNDIEGINFSPPTFKYIDSVISFPFLLENNRRITFIAQHTQIVPELSRSIFSVYGHYPDEPGTKQYKDTLINLNRLEKNTSIDYHTTDLILFSRLNVTGNLPELGISNSYTNTLKLIDMNIEYDQSDSLAMKKNITLPYDIPPEKYISLTGFKYCTKSTGNKIVRVNLEFEDTLGNKILHDAVYYIYGFKPVGVEEQDNTALMADCILSGQKILVRLKESYPDCTFKLYGITGELAFAAQISNSDAEFDLSGLPVGIYFITLRSGSHFYRDKIVLIR